jgi:hypothetical protein
LLILKKYWFELLLLLFQFTPFATIGTLISSFYIFYRIVFVPQIDLLSIFILLLPSIALRQSETLFQSANDRIEEIGWISLYIPTLKNAFLIGPLAISPHLFSALATPIRVVKNLQTSKYYYRVLIWLFTLVIVFSSLFTTFLAGHYSDGGLTVGIRIALSIGVILLPLSIDTKSLNFQIKCIIKISIILFLVGLLQEHWVFVTISFPVFIFYSNESKFWKILSISMLLIIFLSGTSFTTQLVPLLAFILILFYKIRSNIYKRKCAPVISKTSLIVYFFFPIYLVLFVVTSVITPLLHSIGSERFLFKLLEDRGPLWIFTIDLLRTSNFFIVEAARDVEVYDYGVYGSQNWGAGSHNIYLEAARQNGMFVMIIICFILFSQFLEIRKIFIQSKNPLIYFIFSLISVYMVFGLTGNSLIYDGTGFLFWLIFSQTIKSFQKQIAT